MATASRGLSCSAQQNREPAVRFLLHRQPTQLPLPLVFFQRLRCHPKNKKEFKKETQNPINTQSHPPRASAVVFKVSFGVLESPEVGGVNKNEGSAGKIGFSSREKKKWAIGFYNPRKGL